MSFKHVCYLDPIILGRSWNSKCLIAANDPQITNNQQNYV